MPDVREFQPVIESAEKAASAGDFAGAEALLREAAALQEAVLGPRHPDLASTFNNLAVVCEQNLELTDAEQFYRRAYAIAAAGLDQAHPLVATSRDNLRDFCEARGLPFEDPAGVGAPQVSETPVAPRVLPRASPAGPVSPATPAHRPAVAAVGSSRAFASAIALLAVLATLVAAGLWLMSTGGRHTAGADSSTTSTAPPSRAIGASPTTPSAEAVPATPASPSTATLDPLVLAPAPARSAVVLDPPAVLTPPSIPVATRSASMASAPDDLRVLSAAVCHTLTTDGAWRCDAVAAVSAPGRLSYYTRIASSHATRVRHRWYLGNRLRHQTTLAVGANPGTGYRTFSRLTVSPGEWRVELLADSGAVLDQTRFEVR